MATFTVKAPGPFMALLDEKSPANRPGHYQEAWDKAWAFEGESAGAFKGAWDDADMNRALARFESYWRERERKGELVIWGCGSGTFEVVLKPGSGKAVGAKLSCPSGQLIAIPLQGLGAPASACTVEPGHYRAAVERKASTFMIALHPRKS